MFVVMSVCQSVCSRGVLTIQGPLPYHMATPRSQPPPNPYHMGPLLDLLKPIVGCLACKCSGEGNVFTHFCLSDCLFTGGGPHHTGYQPCTPIPPTVQGLASPPPKIMFKCIQLVQGSHPPARHVQTCSLCSPYGR